VVKVLLDNKYLFAQQVFLTMNEPWPGTICLYLMTLANLKYVWNCTGVMRTCG
jgi:hypothetical protein